MDVSETGVGVEVAATAVEVVLDPVSGLATEMFTTMVCGLSVLGRERLVVVTGLSSSVIRSSMI